jgi:hypothetical protein
MFVIVSTLVKQHVPPVEQELPVVEQLVNFITYGCESSAPFVVIYKDGREPTPYW